MRKATFATLTALIIGLAAGCGPPPARPSVEITAIHRDSLPLDPADPAWKGVPVHTEKLLLQDLVEPRLLKPSTKALKIQALSDGQRLAFRIEWEDASKDDLPGMARFADAVAVQLPARVEPDVPAPQMGEPGKPVEITYWSAFWQAAVDGRADTIKALYPGAAVDHYPFEAPSLKAGSPEQKAFAARYAPARALGNLMAGPRKSTVQDLRAEGPGTLTPAAKTLSQGRGKKTEKGWAVVIIRPYPHGLKPGGRGQVAFAVWQGANQEAGARKMRSAWVPLLVEAPK